MTRRKQRNKQARTRKQQKEAMKRNKAIAAQQTMRRDAPSQEYYPKSKKRRFVTFLLSCLRGFK